MSAYAKRDLEAFIPTPVLAATFVCASCLKGSGCAHMFSQIDHPPAERFCQSCGRPVGARSAKASAKQASLAEQFSATADGGWWDMADTDGGDDSSTRH